MKREEFDKLLESLILSEGQKTITEINGSDDPVSLATLYVAAVTAASTIVIQALDQAGLIQFDDD